ncbi:MAG TPA: penicillin-binding protein 2 [Candidatus Limnocylindrales bacterium]|nr:penicillin-binding protein 2 [Candidatus Limnocylindrales bacterium]
MGRILPFQGWRLTLMQGIIGAAFLLFGLRMFQLQVVQYDDLQAAANENRLQELPLASARGVMSDRNGVPIAINVPAFNVTVVPAALPDNQEETLRIYNRLSALTGVPPTRAIADASRQDVRSIEEMVDTGRGIAPYRPVVIAQDVPQRAAMQILEERISLPGVDLDVASVRDYPTGALTSDIVGYMGPIPPEQQLELLEQGYNPAYDRIGYAGLELALEPLLSGVRGRIVNEVDVAGQPLQQVERLDPIAGYSVDLTIDSELQAAAEEALKNEIERLNSEAGRVVSGTGSVIALDPRTGEILAMVSYPSYDNSRFARNIDVDYYLDVAADPLTPLVNHVTQSVYPPGSVWKLITASGVLQENVIDPNSYLYDPGELILPNRYAPNDETRGQRFVCWLPQGHGNLDMRGAMAQSCDVYFYQVGGGNPEVSPAVLRPNGLGIDNLFRYATMFGIGSKLGIEIPFENASRMPDADWKRRLYGENWSTGDTYNAAFGQGYINVTPLQLASAVASIANGGTLYQPTVVREITDSDGNVVRPFQPQVIRSINYDQVAAGEPIRLMMLEDMILQGPSSLACTCEQDSEYYNATRCSPATYTNEININPDSFGAPDMRPYSVHVPFNYQFNDGFCSSIRFDPEYRPPFVSSDNLTIVEEGMRLAVTNGTAQAANLPYIAVAGKTGTAEYCDEIAGPLGLCRPGNWPAHAWFTGYAPYEDPEILVMAFVYNGGEGSAVALPVAVQTLEAYFRLKNEREGGSTAQAPLSSTPITQPEAPVSTPLPATSDPLSLAPVGELPPATTSP